MANDTKYITLENLTRLANKIKANIQLKQDQLQFAELPDAATYSGKVVQYVGDDTTELKAGAFYKSDGTVWVQVSVTETPQPVEQTLALVNSLPAWADADASRVYAVKSTNAVKDKTAVYTIALSSDTLSEITPEDSVESKLTLCDDNSVTPNPDAYMVHVFDEDTVEADLIDLSKLRFDPTNCMKELCYMSSNDSWYMPIYSHELSLYQDMIDSSQLYAISTFTKNNEEWTWLSGPYNRLYSIANVSGAASTVTIKLDHIPTYNDLVAAVEQSGGADAGTVQYSFIVTEPAKPTEFSLGFYAKKADETGAWYTVQTSSAAQPVDLPTFIAISDVDIEAAFEG